MKDTKLHIVGLDSLDEQTLPVLSDPNDPNSVNKAWFFMYCYKVLMCPKQYSHDWGACPYAHNNESARRRDPRRFNYSSCICPNIGKGNCPNGDKCRYAHTLFEYWLHPARFRSQMCKAGTKCRRALCFFAHTPAELRQPDTPESMVHHRCHQPPSLAAAALSDRSLLPSNTACQPCTSNPSTIVEHSIPVALPGTPNLQQPAMDACGSSSSSSFNIATYLQGNTTSVAQDLLPQQRPHTVLPVCSNSSLKAVAPGIAALRAQVPSPFLSAAPLLTTQRPGVAPAAMTFDLMTISTPPQQQQQLSTSTGDLRLGQAGVQVHPVTASTPPQQQQQQQLIASMGDLRLGQAGVQVHSMQQVPAATVLLDPSNASLAVPAASAAGAPPLPLTAVPGPLHISSMVQSAAICAGFNSMAATLPAIVGPAASGSSMLQQVALAGHLPLQQVYQPGAYQVSTPILPYTWMQEFGMK